MQEAKTHNFRRFTKSHLIIIIVGAVVLALILLWPQAVASRKSLGTCLTEKGAVMYGADTCENCINQKKTFGDDFKNVNYVNCEFNIEECRKKGITAYPAWSLDGKTVAGTQTLAALAKFAGCRFPD